jgi:hypothetical protein
MLRPNEITIHFLEVLSSNFDSKIPQNVKKIKNTLKIFSL